MPKKPTANSRGPRVPAHRDRRQPVELGRALVEAFLTNERINQVLLDSLSPEVWRAQPPCSKRRNIATTFAHMHNVRCMRLKMSAPDEKAPAVGLRPLPQLDAACGLRFKQQAMFKREANLLLQTFDVLGLVHVNVEFLLMVTYHDSPDGGQATARWDLRSRS